MNIASLSTQKMHSVEIGFLVLCLCVLCTAWQQSVKRGFASAGISIGLLGSSAMPTFAADVKPGQPAPQFSLPSNTGKDISLADLKGSWSVVYFYPGDFTQGCTIEAKSFESDFKKYSDMGVKILGVSVDSVDKHLDFQKKYGLEFPLVSDNGGKVSDAFGSLLDIPFMGKFSNRQTYIIGPDSKIEWVFRDVESNIPKHSSDVLSKLKELMT